MKKGICYIVAAGENYGLDFVPSNDDYVIAVDGGYLYLEKAQITPNLLIGDFDSLEIMPKLNNITKLNKEKDETDTHSAILSGIKLGYKEFHIYAGTGGRISHTLANIQSLTHIAKLGLKGFLFGNKEILTVIHNTEITFNDTHEGSISIFSLCEQSIGVTLKGLRYPLTNYTMHNGYPIGVSNEFIGKESKISVNKGTLLIVFDFK